MPTLCRQSVNYSTSRRPRPVREAFIDLPDDELGILAAEGVTGAWEELYTRMTPMLQAHAARLKRDPDETDDLVQETMFKAWTYRKNYDPQHHYRVWVHTILARLSASMARHQRVAEVARKQPALVNGSGTWHGRSSSDTDQLAMDSDLRHQLTRVLATLTDKERKVLLACGGGDKPHEIAPKGTPAATVRATLFRARRKAMDAYSLLYPEAAADAMACLLQGVSE